MSEFEQWAEAEVQRAGLFDYDSSYGGMLGESVMKLVRAFSNQGHSGYSAGMAASIFGRLAAWKPLTPITDDPGEWAPVDEALTGGPRTWQSRRAPSCFSRDGGKTYYDIDERPSLWRRVAQKCLRRYLPKMHRSEAGK
jgi:hypothetical protein